MRPFDSIRASQPPGTRQPEDPPLSRRVNTAPSVVTQVRRRVQELAAAGSPVVPLHLCETSVDPPDHVVDAAVAACRSARLQRPTPPAGLPELREAIAAKTVRDSGFDVSAAEVVVTSGRQQSAFNAMATVVDVGDEVLLPAPYWPPHRAAVALMGGRPVTVAASRANGFKVTVEELQAALSPRTTALLLCSPCNPTGAVYTPEELRRIAEWSVSEGLWVITDESYEYLVYGGAEARSLPAVLPSVRDRCLVLNGVTKAYGMGDWRVGWLVGPPLAAKALEWFQSQSDGHAANVAQAAALAALEGGLSPIEEMRVELDRRRLRLVAALSALPGVEVIEPQGTFYAFPSVNACLGGRLGGQPTTTSLELASALLEKAAVAVLPGEAFGRVGHLRVSFALSDDALEDGIDRLAAGLEEAASTRR
jgi:aspartate aminotransferase